MYSDQRSSINNGVEGEELPELVWVCLHNLTELLKRRTAVKIRDCRHRQLGRSLTSRRRTFVFYVKTFYHFDPIWVRPSWWFVAWRVLTGLRNFRLLSTLMSELHSV